MSESARAALLPEQPHLGLCPACATLGLTLIDLPPEPVPEKPDKPAKPEKLKRLLIPEPAFSVLPELVRAWVPGMQLGLFA